MRVLRSRKVASLTNQQSLPKSSGVEIEPLTPAKEVEPGNTLSSYLNTPNSGCNVSNPGLRRSTRLSLNPNLNSNGNNGSVNISRRKRKVVIDSCGNGVLKESGSVIRVSMELDSSGRFESNADIESAGNVKSRRISGFDGEELCFESVQVQDGGVGSKCLSLRSGKKLSKPQINNLANDIKLLSDSKDGKETKGGEDCDGVSESKEEGITVNGEEMDTDRGNDGVKMDASSRFSIEEKGKWEANQSTAFPDRDDLCRKPEEGSLPDTGAIKDGKETKGGEDCNGVSESKEEGVTVNGEEMDTDCGNDGVKRDARGNDGVKRDASSRFSIEGKGKWEENQSTDFSDRDDLHRKPEEGSLPDTEMVDSMRLEKKTVERAEGSSSKMDPKERFKNVARENASRFAHFSIQEEDVDEDELEPQMEANDDVEDWPGPFSTAMKIIKDRASNMPAAELKKTSSASPLIWVPKKNDQQGRSMKVAPSLEELCIEIMIENVDAITSLERVPDAIRHKLTQALCDSRNMNYHFFNLLASQSPSEIRIKDCSWLDEDRFSKTFEAIDASNLTVLQLDQCGRCLPDYVLYTTLNPLPTKLSALTNISLKGACRLSDAGLDALVTSASALRSINLGCCSLLTSDGINNLADKLGSVLKELYIDECFGLDAKSILPALFKLHHLEVLSISRFESVNDSFITQFVAVQGHKMKELVLANCTKLTDRALKAIAKSCPGLCAIDLTNLCKLTDTSLGHLANGCQSIQTMKFCRNAFSDEAVAAYLEACGGPLTELSLNHVDKVAHQTALSLAKHAKNLQSLDLSWCRDMTDEAVGLIVDSCLSLKMLKLFGCTQITNVFTDWHSNEYVKIIGLQESQILKNIAFPDLLPLRYSSV